MIQRIYKPLNRITWIHTTTISMKALAMIMKAGFHFISLSFNLFCFFFNFFFTQKRRKSRRKNIFAKKCHILRMNAISTHRSRFDGNECYLFSLNSTVKCCVCVNVKLRSMQMDTWRNGMEITNLNSHKRSLSTSNIINNKLLKFNLTLTLKQRQRLMVKWTRIAI